MTGILGWQNETGQSTYPLSKSFLVKDFIVDASFLQFDNFVPTLKTVVVKETEIELTVICDQATIVATIPDSHVVGTAIQLLNSNRYLGKIVIGPGMDTLFSDYLNKTINGSQFLPIVVNSINSAGGVYSIGGVNNNVVLTTDENQFFNITGQNVIWNAVGVPSLQAIQPLKKLNGVSPTFNNVNIVDSDTIKLVPTLNGLIVRLNNGDVTDNISPAKHYA